MTGLLDKLIIVQPSSVGRNWKYVVTTGLRHPFIKTAAQWQLPDKFLASLGKYWTTTLTGKFERMAAPGLRSMQYFDPGATLDIEENPDYGNVLDVERIGDGSPSASGPPSGLADFFEWARYEITYNNQIWNLYNSYYEADPDMVDLLDKILAGDPFYIDYLQNGIVSSQLPGAPSLLLWKGASASPNIPALVDTQPQYSQRMFELNLPAQNDMNASALNVQAIPMYNYYVGADRVNSYESAVADLPESVIPNFYMLHYSVAPSGDIIPRYQNQITFNGNVGSFDDPIEDRGQFFSSYATTLKALKTARDENIVPKDHPDYVPSDWSDAVGTLRTLGFNIGIYSENLSILEGLSTIPAEERVESSITDMPMYVDLKIDHNQSLDIVYPASVTSPGKTVAQLLTEQELTAGQNLYDMVLSMIVQQDVARTDYLECTMAIERSTRTTTTEGEIITDLPTQIINQSLHHNIFPSWQGALMGGNYWLYSGLDLDSMLANPWTLGPSTGNGTNLIDPVNLEAPGMSVPSGTGSITQATVDSSFNDFYFPSTSTLTAGQLFNSLRKSDIGIMNLDSGYSETFMYKVEKRVVESGAFIPLDQLNDADGPNGEPLYPVVQTFYIAVDPDQVEKTIRYIDTQVKYGVVYQYNFTQIRFILSTLYDYDDLQVQTDYDGMGRALGNALGFYVDEQIDNPPEIDQWDYVPWGQDTPVAFEQVGHLVLPYSDNQGPGPNDPDLSNHMIQLKPGYGFNSNNLGGAVTTGPGLNLAGANASAAADLFKTRGNEGVDQFGPDHWKTVEPTEKQEEMLNLLDRLADVGEMHGEKLLEHLLTGHLPSTGGGFNFGDLNPSVHLSETDEMYGEAMSPGEVAEGGPYEEKDWGRSPLFDEGII